MTTRVSHSASFLFFTGEAEAIIAKAKARAAGINKVSDALAAQV